MTSLWLCHVYFTIYDQYLNSSHATSAFYALRMRILVFFRLISHCGKFTQNVFFLSHSSCCRKCIWRLTEKSFLSGMIININPSKHSMPHLFSFFTACSYSGSSTAVSQRARTKREGKHPGQVASLLWRLNILPG